MKSALAVCLLGFFQLVYAFPGELRVSIVPSSLITTEENAEFSIFCRVFPGSRSITTIKWTKDGIPLPTNEIRFRIESLNYLVVSSAKPSDSGIYKCTAYDSVESASGAVNVTVNGSSYLRG
eukprot:m.138296 g.138296  ORF g.138296 m.138296 type:complete len:122 (+) comp38246_c0_seq14:1024-1389(+)